jgi:NosR/NirI family transcriptional regulator, nitrous oxide reductase regulator
MSAAGRRQNGECARRPTGEAESQRQLPLTTALSPSEGERENHTPSLSLSERDTQHRAQSASEAQDAVLSKDRHNRFPLPFRRGEGQGEGCLGRDRSSTPPAGLLPKAVSSGPARPRVVAMPGWVLPALLIWILLSALAFGEQRFPPPDFEGGHQLPVTATPPARALVLAYLDVAVLAGSLGLASWLIYKRRSRKGLLALSLFSLLYFGFWRKGCVCAIGSVQNVALALWHPAYAVPLGVLAFFVLPLAFSLFAGRAFCAGVCPHGALQDLVLLKPVKVPAALEQALSILPYIYLGAGVLFAATGSTFLICQYDPFVPIFRMSGRTLMVLSGVALLLLGVFVGRPYCRFLCPYGALLKLGAMVAKWRVRVTPDFCTQCRLCEAACPFGAMREPTATKPEPQGLVKDRRRLALLLALLPALMAGGGWLGFKFSVPASGLNPTVSLAERLVREQDVVTKPGTLSPDDLELERARQTPKEILTDAAKIRREFALGGGLLGAWIGLVIGAKLVGLSLHRRRTDYEPDRGECFACARCFDYCPNERLRRGLLPLDRQMENGLLPVSEANRTRVRDQRANLSPLPFRRGEGQPALRRLGEGGGEGSSAHGSSDRAASSCSNVLNPPSAPAPGSAG